MTTASMSLSVITLQLQTSMSIKLRHLKCDVKVYYSQYGWNKPVLYLLRPQKYSCQLLHLFVRALGATLNRTIVPPIAGVKGPNIKGKLR